MPSSATASWAAGDRKDKMQPIVCTFQSAALRCNLSYVMLSRRLVVLAVAGALAATHPHISSTASGIPHRPAKDAALPAVLASSAQSTALACVMACWALYAGPAVHVLNMAQLVLLPSQGQQTRGAEW